MRLAIGINDGPYRLRTASDAVWVPSYGYGQRSTLGRRIADACQVILRMVIPVLGLCAGLAALFLYMATPVPYLGQTAERWMSISNLLVPASFLAIHLANRRYGPAYAFAQIVVSFAVLVAATVLGGDAVRGLLPAAAAPLLREAVAFAAAFVLSGFLAIVAFDGARGPRWWTAPLVGSAVGAVSFAPLFYAVAYAGTNTPWVDHMLVEAAVLCGGAVVMLLPYWMLRRLVQPLPGYGGY